MKNFKLLLLAAVLLCAAYSCEKAEAPMSSSEPEMVSLILSTGEPTKTHISDVVDSEGFTEIHWDQGDQIKVFTNARLRELNSDALSNDFSFSLNEFQENSKFAKFKGSVTYRSTKFWAVYPYDRANSCSYDNGGKDIKVTIPSGQSAANNTFANNLNISVARGTIVENTGENIGYGQYELTEPIFVDFKNVCALLKFTAPSNASQISSVTISANEDIAGEMTIDYSDEVKDPKVTSVSGSKSITMAGPFVAGQDYYFVVAPVAISGISMTIQTTDGQTRYLTKITKSENSNTYQLQPGVVMSLGTVNLDKMKTVTATATHQTPSNVLSGTNVAFNLNDNSATSVNLTVKKSDNTDNTATRTVNALTSAYTSDNTWPYLPAGDYTFSGSFTSNGVYVHVPSTSFIVPALTDSQLTVGEFTPFTSYSKKSTPAVANALDGSTIYSDVTINVSSDILNNTNYSSMITVNGKSPVYTTVDGKLCVGFGGNDWTSYDIDKITWIFDGVSASHTLEIPQTVHVTGIPHKYNFYNNESDATSASCPWKLTNTHWTIGKCCIFYTEYKLSGKLDTEKKGYLHSPKFYIPANNSINVNCSTQAQYYVLMGGASMLDVSDFSAEVRVGVTGSNSSVSSSPVKHTLAASKNPSDSFYNPVSSLTMTNSLNYISIHHNEPSRPSKKVGSSWISWTEYAQYWYINIGEVYIYYR